MSERSPGPPAILEMTESHGIFAKPRPSFNLYLFKSRGEMLRFGHRGTDYLSGLVWTSPMEVVRPEAHPGPTPVLPYDRHKECDAPFSDSTLVAKHRAHCLLLLIDRALCVTSLLVGDLARLDAIFGLGSYLVGSRQAGNRYGDLRRIRRCPIFQRARGLPSGRAC